MSSKLVGSIVYGAAGIGCKVLAVEGDTLKVETPKGIRTISLSKVVKVDPPPLVDRLTALASLGKREAINELTSILSESTVNSIYEASLDLDTFLGIFIRRSLEGISPLEFAEIGKDGSEGKYGVSTFPASPPPVNLTSNEIGNRVTHTDLYHCYGADVGTIELIDSCGDYHVRWDSEARDTLGDI